jgi:hypothetical protein
MINVFWGEIPQLQITFSSRGVEDAHSQHGTLLFTLQFIT